MPLWRGVRGVRLQREVWGGGRGSAPGQGSRCGGEAAPFRGMEAGSGALRGCSLGLCQWRPVSKQGPCCVCITVLVRQVSESSRSA